MGRGSSCSNEVTHLLRQWRGGNREALDRLMPLVYEELRRQARDCMRAERTDHTLQTTALVHEAYVRLVDSDVDWQDRVHFYAVAARSMRRILVDHARSHRAAKRGGGETPLPLESALVVSPAPSRSILDLDSALDQLAEQDERKARVVELHFFGGLSYEEIAGALEISPATVHRDMRMARAWLRRELSHGEPGADGR